MTILNDGQGNVFYVEQGVPLDYAKRGATTTAQYQTMASQDLSDKQIQAQKAIADQQNELNQRSFDAQQGQYQQQQQQVDEQAQRQAQYDAGRADLLGQGTQQVNDAFSRFSPEYFKYAQNTCPRRRTTSSVSRIGPEATRLSAGTAGISASQAGVNEQGLRVKPPGVRPPSKTLRAAVRRSQSNVAGPSRTC
jgi:hypothetical protein